MSIKLRTSSEPLARYSDYGGAPICSVGHKKNITNLDLFMFAIK